MNNLLLITLVPCNRTFSNKPKTSSLKAMQITKFNLKSLNSLLSFTNKIF
jgi:hypothetical protein